MKTSTDSVMKTLTKFVWYCRKVFVHMIMWIVGKDSMKLYYQTKTNSILAWQWKTSQMLTINTLKIVWKILEYKTSANVMFCKWRVIHYYWQMSMKLLQRMYRYMWGWSCILSVSTWISMASMSDEDRRKIGIVDRC